MQLFWGLATTSDLYQFTQLATSWLKGHFLEDNCYGYHLSIHTYFFCPVLAILVWPLGAIGLLLALGLAAAAGFVAIVAILRLFAVPLRVACPFAALVTLMPLALHVYQDAIYGFHIELLLPAMALWLAYFLLRRNWGGSLAMALIIISVKEDTPLVVMAVGSMIFCEDVVRAIAPRPGSTRGWRRAVNVPAAVVVLLGAVAVPVLLHILELNPPSGYAPGSFERLKPIGGIQLADSHSLFSYVVGNLDAWRHADVISRWETLAVSSTFGLVLLRPYYIAIGLPLTVISWLMRDDILWAPRFAASLAFLQIAQVLAFASACAVVRRLFTVGKLGRAVAAAVVVLLACAFVQGARRQFAEVPDTAEIYTLNPKLPLSPEDRSRADRLFSIYRREGKADEPVIASPLLFRYAHDRNLFWFDRMENRPEPVWILWDDVAIPRAVDPQKYELKGRRGRFSLYKMRTS